MNRADKVVIKVIISIPIIILVFFIIFVVVQEIFTWVIFDFKSDYRDHLYCLENELTQDETKECVRRFNMKVPDELPPALQEPAD
jgi:hypothetical protein